MDKQPLLNTYVSNITKFQAVAAIDQFISEKKKSYIVAINVDVVMKIEKDSRLKEITDNADIVLVDGKPIIWISRLHKKPIREKVSGSDLVPLLCENAAHKGHTIFLLGGAEGVAKQAKLNLEKKYLGIKIVGIYAPPYGFETDNKELEKINNLISATKPDILIVCFGCPKQEKFIYDNYQKSDATVFVCAGATVDFLAEKVKRAPRWMSEHGFEWFYRFLQEPRRMFKRYFWDDIKILGLIWKYR